MPAATSAVRSFQRQHCAHMSTGSDDIIMHAQVNYVGKAANLYEDAGYQLSGSAYVVNKHLGTTWLWDRVRVSGGAYGGFSDFDTHSGMFSYLSYRDPNLIKTVRGCPPLLPLGFEPDPFPQAPVKTVCKVLVKQLVVLSRMDCQSWPVTSRLVQDTPSEPRTHSVC